MLLQLDLCTTQEDWRDESYAPVEIPACDWYLDPKCTGNKEMPFYRAKYDETEELKFIHSLFSII